jgi:hypothetical protein
MVEPEERVFDALDRFDKELKCWTVFGDERRAEARRYDPVTLNKPVAETSSVTREFFGSVERAKEYVRYCAMKAALDA